MTHDTTARRDEALAKAAEVVAGLARGWLTDWARAPGRALDAGLTHSSPSARRYRCSSTRLVAASLARWSGPRSPH